MGTPVPGISFGSVSWVSKYTTFVALGSGAAWQAKNSRSRSSSAGFVRKLRRAFCTAAVVASSLTSLQMFFFGKCPHEGFCSVAYSSSASRCAQCRSRLLSA